MADNFSIEKQIESDTGNMVSDNVESYSYSLAYDLAMLERYRRKISINGADGPYVDVSEDDRHRSFHRHLLHRR
jgi:hypothetical protein